MPTKTKCSVSSSEFPWLAILWAVGITCCGQTACAFESATDEAASQLRGYKAEHASPIGSITDVFKPAKSQAKPIPPPVLPKPPTPPDDTRFSVDLRSPEWVPDVSRLRRPDVELEPVDVSQLPILKAATGPLPPLRLEASYTEPVTARQVLTMELENNLPIKIARTEQRVKQYELLSAFGALLPTSATGFVRPHTWSRSTQISNPSFFQIVYLPVFQGGQDIFGFLAARNTSRAATQFARATVNDQLRDIYLSYQDLILQRALLQVRIKAVEVSQTQLQMNDDMKTVGEGTTFEVLQSRSQLLKDQQDLLKQQVDLRHASIKLATALNVSPTTNFMPADDRVTVVNLINPALSIVDLTKLAIEHRPELKRYEELKLAARRQIVVAASHLYPNASFYIANDLSATNTRGGMGSGGSNGGVVIPAGNILAGGLINVGNTTGGANNEWVNSFSAGFLLDWLLPGMGVPDMGRVLASKQQARKVGLEANEVFIQVVREVHDSYLDVFNSRAEIPVAEEAVVTAAEELRDADRRHKYGVGVNLDVLQAQRDYISALTRQIEALISYRKAQARLLRDIGTISVDTLTTGGAW